METNIKKKGEDSDDVSNEIELTLNKLKVKKLLSQFECPVCMNHITPPILQCLNGHIICRECQRKLSPKTCPTCRKPMPTEECHTLALEQIAVNIGLKFQCKFQALGCQTSLLLSEKANHEKCCQYEPFHCPGLDGPCNWSGNEEQLIQHLADVHKFQRLIGNNFHHQLDTKTLNNQESYKSAAVFHFNYQYFIWCFTKKFTKSDDRIFTYFVVFIGKQSDANKYKYKCEIVKKSNGSRLMFEGIPNSIRDKKSFTDSECLVFTSVTTKRYLDNGVLDINLQMMNT